MKFPKLGTYHQKTIDNYYYYQPVVPVSILCTRAASEYYDIHFVIIFSKSYMYYTYK